MTGEVACHDEVEADAEYGKEGRHESGRVGPKVKPRVPADVQEPAQCDPGGRRPKTEPSEESERQETEDFHPQPLERRGSSGGEEYIEDGGNDEADRQDDSLAARTLPPGVEDQEDTDDYTESHLEEHRRF